MKNLMPAWTLALAAAVCSADDFSKFSDLEFAERYAFSTNRAELVSELKRGSGQWYFYSLLNFQNARRPDEESKFLNSNARDGLSDDAWRRLQLRHMFLAWEANPGGNAGRTTDEFLSRFGIESLEQLPPLPEAEEPENEGEHEELIP